MKFGAVPRRLQTRRATLDGVRESLKAFRRTNGGPVLRGQRCRGSGQAEVMMPRCLSLASSWWLGYPNDLRSGDRTFPVTVPGVSV